MSSKDYKYLSEDELVNYYTKVRDYIEKGFRTDGLKEELEIILQEIEQRPESKIKYKGEYIKELKHYLRTIRL